MSIYEYRDYKQFFRNWLKMQPKFGRGILSKMAVAASMSAGMLSHVFNGNKDLSMEAANDIGGFMGLSDDEIEYLLLLVSFARAGNHSLKERLKKQVIAEQKKANELENKLKPERDLSDLAKSLFYSHWLYTGVRNMTACPQFNNVDQIAEHLKIPRAHAQRVIDFLLQHNLCILKNGHLLPGPQITHIGNQTSLVNKHHQNWRLQSMNKMFDPGEKNLFFTSPMSLSIEASEEIRNKIATFVEQIKKVVAPSNSEVVRCLNIDWFEY